MREYARFIGTLVLLMSAPAVGADLDWQRNERGLVTIFIEGRIVAGDEEKFRKLMLERIDAGSSVRWVHIYSPGGSVAAAVEIGKQIRTLKISTVAPQQLVNGPVGVVCLRREYDQQGKKLSEADKRHWVSGRDARRSARHPDYSVDARCTCASACFLIWAAGSGREGDWIGVHRPFFEASEYGKLSAREAEQRYTGMADDVRAYLREMDIPDDITRKMMAASSENIHYLSPEEVKSLANAHAIEELEIAKCGGVERFQREWAAAVKQGNKSLQQQLDAQMELRWVCYVNLMHEVFRDSVPAYLRRYGMGR